MTMLEKVARAIWQARHSRAEISKAWKFDELGTATQADLCSEARAAIEAMRTPTYEIGAAIYQAWDVFGEDAIMGPEEAIAIWRAGIGAALTPAPEKSAP